MDPKHLMIILFRFQSHQTYQYAAPISVIPHNSLVDLKNERTEGDVSVLIY